MYVIQSDFWYYNNHEKICHISVVCHDLKRTMLHVALGYSEYWDIVSQAGNSILDQ